MVLRHFGDGLGYPGLYHTFFKVFWLSKHNELANGKFGLNLGKNGTTDQFYSIWHHTKCGTFRKGESIQVKIIFQEKKNNVNRIPL